MIAEVLKGYWHNGRTQNLHFYRDRAGNQIDLLIEQDNCLYPVEIKKAATPSRSAARGFGMLHKLGLRIGAGALLCLRETDLPLSADLTAIPIRHL